MEILGVPEEEFVEVIFFLINMLIILKLIIFNTNRTAQEEAYFLKTIKRLK